MERRAKASGTAANTFYNIAYRVFSILLPLLTAPYLSRTVGQEGVGLYSYAWSISYIACLIGKLGLADYGVRTIVRVRDDREQLDRTFSQIWTMQLLVAGVTLVGYIAFVLFGAGEEKTIALHFTLMSVSCLVDLDWCLMGLDRFRAIAIRNTCVKLLAAAAVFLFVRGPEDLWIYAFVWSLSTLIGCVSCALSLRGTVRYHRPSLREALTHLRPCAVLFISVMAVNVYRTMDKVMIGAMSSMEQNGYYENAEKIIYCLSGFISAVGTVMLPKVSHMLRQGKRDEVIRHIDLSMQLVLCMVCAMAFGLAAVAEDLAPLFYGEAFRYSGTLMVPLAMTLIMIGFANVIRTQWILPQSRDSVFVRSVTTGAAIDLVANAVFIPRYGAAGALVGTLLAEGSVPVVQFLILRKELPYRRYLLYLLEYCAAGLVMTLTVWAVRGLLPSGWGGLALQVLIGAACYGVLCLGLWIVTKNRRVLRLIPILGKRLARQETKSC